MATQLSELQVKTLLYDLCVQLGFCLPTPDQQRLERDPPSEVDAFTDAVFIAEGMDPWNNLHLRRQVKERIAAAFWAAGKPGTG